MDPHNYDLHTCRFCEGFVLEFDHKSEHDYWRGAFSPNLTFQEALSAVEQGCRFMTWFTTESSGLTTEGKGNLSPSQILQAGLWREHTSMVGTELVFTWDRKGSTTSITMTVTTHLYHGCRSAPTQRTLRLRVLSCHCSAADPV